MVNPNNLVMLRPIFDSGVARVFLPLLFRISVGLPMRGSGASGGLLSDFLTGSEDVHFSADRP